MAHLDFEALQIILSHLDIGSYLDLHSLKRLSIAASFCNKLLNKHISDNCTFLKKSKDPLRYTTKRLTIGKEFKSFDLISLPPYITHLNLGQYFNESVDNMPTFITHLKFGDHFNQPAYNLPPKLIAVRFGSCFNQKVDNLPLSLKYLTMSSNAFTHSLDKLPISLRYLDFSCYHFTHSLDYLPSSLSHLIFNAPGYYTLDHLPTSLSHLTIWTAIFALDNLPTSLTYCNLTDGSTSQLRYIKVDQLPSSLKRLKLRWIGSYDYLSPSITHLSLCTSYYMHFDYSFDNLPDSVTHLSIETVTRPIDHLPSSLHTLLLSENSMYYVDYLPAMLKRLEVKDTDNGEYFNKHIDHLPPTLTHLSLGHNFCKRIDNLPSSLKYLRLGWGYRKPIDHLPALLTTLVVPLAMQDKLEYLPPSIHTIQFESEELELAPNH